MARFVLAVSTDARVSATWALSRVRSSTTDDRRRSAVVSLVMRTRSSVSVLVLDGPGLFGLLEALELGLLELPREVIEGGLLGTDLGLPVDVELGDRRHHDDPDHRHQEYQDGQNFSRGRHRTSPSPGQRTTGQGRGGVTPPANISYLLRARPALTTPSKARRGATLAMIATGRVGVVGPARRSNSPPPRISPPAARLAASPPPAGRDTMGVPSGAARSCKARRPIVDPRPSGSEPSRACVPPSP